MGPARPLRDRTIVSVPIKMRNQILIRSGVCGDVEDQDPVVRYITAALVSPDEE